MSTEIIRYRTPRSRHCNVSQSSAGRSTPTRRQFFGHLLPVALISTTSLEATSAGQLLAHGRQQKLLSISLDDPARRGRGSTLPFGEVRQAERGGGAFRPRAAGGHAALRSGSRRAASRNSMADPTNSAAKNPFRSRISSGPLHGDPNSALSAIAATNI